MAVNLYCHGTESQVTILLALQRKLASYESTKIAWMRIFSKIHFSPIEELLISKHV